MSLLAREGGVAERFAAWGAEWLPGERLSRHTSLGVGGPADIVRVRWVPAEGQPWAFGAETEPGFQLAV